MQRRIPFYNDHDQRIQREFAGEIYQKNIFIKETDHHPGIGVVFNFPYIKIAKGKGGIFLHFIIDGKNVLSAREAAKLILGEWEQFIMYFLEDYSENADLLLYKINHFILRTKVILEPNEMFAVVPLGYSAIYVTESMVNKFTGKNNKIGKYNLRILFKKIESGRKSIMDFK